MSSKYFIESINTDQFISVLCPDYKTFKSGKCKNNRVAIMGENVNVSSKGIYFLDVNNKPPYAMGKN